MQSCRKRAGFSFQNLDFHESDKVRGEGEEICTEPERCLVFKHTSGVAETESGQVRPDVEEQSVQIPASISPNFVFHP